MSRKPHQTRWMKSALREAARCETQMPYARGQRKSAAERRAETRVLHRVAS